MARASKPGVPSKSSGSQHYAAEVNAFDTAIDAVIDDYLSLTETSDQNVAGKVVFAQVFEGSGSGTSPITIAHGLGDTPTKVFVSVNAVQPYAVAYNADATNVKVYHNAAGSLTVSVRAVL